MEQVKDEATELLYNNNHFAYDITSITEQRTPSTCILVLRTQTSTNFCHKRSFSIHTLNDQSAFFVLRRKKRSTQKRVVKRIGSLLTIVSGRDRSSDYIMPNKPHTCVIRFLNAYSFFRRIFPRTKLARVGISCSRSNFLYDLYFIFFRLSRVVIENIWLCVAIVRPL